MFDEWSNAVRPEFLAEGVGVEAAVNGEASQVPSVAAGDPRADPVIGLLQLVEWRSVFRYRRERSPSGPERGRMTGSRSSGSAGRGRSRSRRWRRPMRDSAEALRVARQVAVGIAANQSRNVV